MHTVKPTDRYVDQLDLFLIHHFDNRARSTSLKVLEFNMRADNISDLPFPVGTNLTLDQVPVLKQYNRHDVTMTKRFYHAVSGHDPVPRELTARYQRDFMNHNDTKIGKDYFVMEPEAAGVACWTTVPRVASPGRPGARASRSGTPSCRGSVPTSRVPAGAGVVQAADDHRDQGVFRATSWRGCMGLTLCSAWADSRVRGV